MTPSDVLLPSLPVCVCVRVRVCVSGVARQVLASLR